MKKTFSAVATMALLGGASSVAMAQSSVTLYGIVDASIGGKKTTTNGGSTKTTGVFGSQDNGMSPSRWGLRGSEELGDGLRANFNLEQRFNNATGTLTGALFNGRSVVGLSGNFGNIDFGREYTPMFLLNVLSDVEGQSSYSINNRFGNAGNAVRRDRSITYTTPNFSGLTVKAQLGHNTSEVDAGTVSGKAKDRGVGLSAKYENGPFIAGVAYDDQKTTTLQYSTAATPVLLGTSPESRVKTWELIGIYDFGVAKLYGTYIDIKATAEGSVIETKDREANLGVRVPIGVFDLVGAVGRNKRDVTGQQGLSGTDYSVGAIYNLSKRTALHVHAARKDTLANDTSNSKSTILGVGVRHFF